MSGPTPHEEIGRGFDRAADSYDQEMGANPAMAYMRRVSLAALHASYRPGQRVLEIGCGTGEEAISLASRGVRVLATDLSPEMLALAARKVTAAELQEAIELRLLAAAEVSSLLDEHGPGSFDGAYSSFGPLNGEPDLRPVAEALAGLVRAGGLLVVSVMNRVYPLEILWYLAHGHPRQAVRRWKGRVRAGVSPTLKALVPTWYHTPRSFSRAFAPEFRPLRCRALPFLLPPPYLSHLWRRHPSLLGRLEPWEERLSDRWPFYAQGDHFLLTLQRKSPPV
jgi:SAM-dependent methyltransferase